jgi:predicted NodU family carbamoyl transferase
MAHEVYHSNFERGAVAVVDEYGESNSLTFGRFKGDELTVLRKIPYPYSLDMFYAVITEYLGFKFN